MDEQGLKKFVENMRTNGMPDTEIELSLQNAGHQQPVIDSLLGKSPEQINGQEHRQAQDPIIDPANPPQIIRDHGSTLEKQTQPTPEQQANMQPVAPPPAEAETIMTKKVTLTPQNTDVAPATTGVAANAPVPASTSTNPPSKNADGSVDMEQANSLEAVTAGLSPATPPPTPVQGMPDPSAPAPTSAQSTSIYPDATKGHMAHTAGPPPAEKPDIEALMAYYPDFESNPLKVLGYAVTNFAKNAGYMIGAILIGGVLAVAFLRLLGWLAEQIAKWTSTVGGLYAGGTDNVWISLGVTLAIFTVVYSVVIAVFITLWRTVQLSIVLDIVRGDKPDFGGAFNRIFSWFGRIFHANFVLVLKLAVLFDVLFLIAYGVVLERVSEDGFGALRYFVWAFYIWLATSLIVVLRNSYVHMLMLDSGTNRARDASSDSIQLVNQPRQKFLELLAWTGIGIILYQITRISLLLVFGEDPVSSLSALNVLFTDDISSLSNLPLEIAGMLIGASIIAISDIGLGRYFLSSKGLLKTARQIGPINPINFIVIILAIASIWGGGRIVNQIEADKWQREYEVRQEQRQSEQSDTNFQTTELDPNDWDANGILDEDQCGPNEYAFPSFVEYDETTRRSIYEIECV